MKMELILTRFRSLATCFVWTCLVTGGSFWGTVAGQDNGGGSLDSCNNTKDLQFINQWRQLISCLMKDYDPSVRPTYDVSKPVPVTLDSVIMSITSLDEKTGVLTTDSWLKQTWIDVQLRWKPSDFGGLNEIQLPADKLWTPQIVLYNNADESFRYVMDKHVTVNSSGHVIWVPHARLRSFCDLDLTLFPYDTQTCRLYLGSWAYDESLVNIKIPEVNPFLPKTVDWEVIDYNVRAIDFTDDVKRYPTVVYMIRLKRISIFYRYILVAPSILLAFLTLLLFWIPTDSKERFMLASGILVSLTVLLVLLEGFLPTSLGQLPVIASYIGFNFVLLMMTITVSVATLNCQYRGVRNGQVPSWIQWVFLGRLSRVLCVKIPSYTKSSSSMTMSLVNEENDARRDLDEIFPSDPRIETMRNAVPPLTNDSTITLERTLEEIRRYLRHLAAKSDTAGQVAPHSEVVRNEWLLLALVIDRLVFWVFLFVSIITTIIIYGHS